LDARERVISSLLHVERRDERGLLFCTAHTEPIATRPMRSAWSVRVDQ